MTAATERFGDQLAVVDGDTRLSYRELVEAARSFAAALVASGVRARDRVAIWCPNRAEWIVAVLGVWEAGATLVPINTRFKGGEAADILSRSHARVLVTVTDFLGADYVAMLEGSGVDLPDLDIVVVAHGPASVGAVAWRRVRRPRRHGRPRRGGAAGSGGHARRSVRHPVHVRYHGRRRRVWCRPTAGRCASRPTGSRWRSSRSPTVT